MDNCEPRKSGKKHPHAIKKMGNTEHGQLIQDDWPSVKCNCFYCRKLIQKLRITTYDCLTHCLKIFVLVRKEIQTPGFGEIDPITFQCCKETKQPQRIKINATWIK